MFRGMQTQQKLVLLSILITETAERVAYYGFRAVLVLYFSEVLRFDDNQAVALFAVTTAVAYFSPLLGALLADGAWGRYRTIWKFGWMYVFGLCLLTVGAYSAEQSAASNVMDDGDLGMERFLSFFGLLLVCTGTGGIKPCVSAFGADQIALQDIDQDNEEEAIQLRDEQLRVFFASFYFCVNVGAVSSFAIIPIIKKYFGYSMAFLIPTVFMVFALLIFYSRSHQYKHSEQQQQHQSSDPHDEVGQTLQQNKRPSLLEIFQVCGRILRERFRGHNDPIYRQVVVSSYETVDSKVDDDTDLTDRATDRSKDTLGKENPLYADTTDPNVIEYVSETAEAKQHKRYHAEIYEDAAQALHLVPILLMFPVFWMLYDQQSSVWILQAKRMALHGLQPEQLNVVNPAEILIFIPLFDQVIYPFMERHGWSTDPLKRMQYGMFLASLAFFTSCLLERYLQSQPESTVHVAWQIPQLTLLTAGEIFLNVTGLEFAYAQAPDNMQALILAIYLCMTSIGDGMAAILYASVFASLNMVVVLAICAVLMLANLMLFMKVSATWKPYVRSSVHHADDHTQEIEMGETENDYKDDDDRGSGFSKFD